MRPNHSRICILLASTWLLAMTVATAQTPSFQPLVTGQFPGSAQYVDGLVYVGLQMGGLVEWDPGEETTRRHLTRAQGLGGHYVQDLAWSGVHLWVATSDGGLTAIADPGGSQESLRIFSSAIASLDVTTVTGQFIGSTERVYYGTNGAGIGEIVSGLPGAFYSIQDGLIDDTIDDMALSGDLLLVATPSGLSRFAENTFTNYPYGDADTEAVIALERAADGTIWAATQSGVKRWNDETRSLEVVLATGFTRDIAIDDNDVYALTSSETLFRIREDVGTSITIPALPEGHTRDSRSLAAGGGGIWTAGRARNGVMASPNTRLWQPWVGESDRSGALADYLDTCIIGATGGFDGVAFDDRNRAWLGDREGDGLAALSAEGWYNVFQLATEDNDSLGLFNHFGNLLAMAGQGGDIWFGQFGTGAIRFQPAESPGGEEEWDLFRPLHEPIQGRQFIQIGTHPDGQVLLCTTNDAPDENLGVDVLVDPERPFAADAWLHLDADVLGGANIWAVGVERRDVIWFGVRGDGLQRWDINGLAAGPDDPLTWLDTSDDHWRETPLGSVPGSQYDFLSANAIAFDPADGSLWIGAGSGLVNFTYDEFFGNATLVQEWGEKEQTFVPGLLGARVLGLGFDRNQALWALTSNGLNRLQFASDGGVTFDAFTDLATYFSLDPSFYSPNIIVPLSGGTYRRLALSADGTRLALTSDLGGTLVDIPAVGSGGDGETARSFLYPNPFPGDSGAELLSLGGLDSSEATAQVEILNLAGQVVYRNRSVANEVGFWDGRNRQGRLVASGLYVVRVEHGGRTEVLQLAVTF